MQSETSDQLPSCRHLTTVLISSINPSTRPDQTTFLAAADAQIKSTLLTLYTLFPNELLPALDLLDRGLVTRLKLAIDEHGSTYNTELLPDQSLISTYYVRSAQPPSTHSRSKHRTVQTPTYYEVHLNSWSCSCPAFAFSAFPATIPALDSPDLVSAMDVERTVAKYGWVFGGLGRGMEAPVCKHLLACVLAERCEGFARGMVEEREVSREEMAGWAAGWGD
ncbi:hypothetical protein B0A48_15303 [Cryoendolithus antarcticus]|uniref:SWIM-type domain-containing protein n=1 Tax=Cryoendolithus antarcticus TaxID=1507870 RepID=A0A1V8SHY2_9PEZI|nr:hypothetical protein B0A48_15303 [Cryoendolithus antarcticus]